MMDISPGKEKETRQLKMMIKTEKRFLRILMEEMRKEIEQQLK
jgi:hypothetical protein